MKPLAFGLLILSLGLVGCSTTSTTSNDNKQTSVGLNSSAPTKGEIQETLKLVEKRVDRTFEEVAVLMCDKISKQDYQSAIDTGAPVMVGVDNPKDALGDANFLALCTLLYISYEGVGYDEGIKIMRGLMGGEEAAETFAVLFKENLDNPVGVLNALKENLK